MASKEGMAIYLADTNELEVVRPGENNRRRIKCSNLNPKQSHVFGVQVQGDEIWVLTGPKSNSRPNRKYIYKFSSLSGGGSTSC